MQCRASAQLTSCHTLGGATRRALQPFAAGQKVLRDQRFSYRAVPANLRVVRAEVQQQQAPAAAAAEESDSEERVPPGCARYTVQLPKPLGLVLEEGSSGRGVFVAEVVPEGNAARLAPQISVGDELVATSGKTYTTQQEYQGNIVKGGEKMVRLNVRNNDFKTVMAAIGSHPAQTKVTLEFQRCD